MSIRVQFRRGNTAQTSTFTGAYAEATIDVTKHTIVVHDGSTQGGFPLALESSLNVITSDASAASSYANSSYLKANSAYLSQNSTGNYANNAYLHANASYLSQNTSGDYANSAFTKANTATTAAATADQRAVTSGVYANSAYAQANTANTNAATADQRAVTSGSYANTALGIAELASIYANGAFAFANTVNAYAYSAYEFANTSNVYFYGVNAQQNTNITSASSYANGAFAAANTADQKGVSAGSYANSAYAKANNALANTTGTLSGDLTITGNLIVKGNTFSANVTNLEITDSIIYLASNNDISDSLDIGFVGHYNSGANLHTGLIRHAADDTYYLFKKYPLEPYTNVIDIANTQFTIATLKANLTSDVVSIRGYDPINHTNSSFSVANTADQRAVTSGSYANSAYIQANTATTNAATADQRAVTSGSYANTAYAQANTATTNAATADQRAVTSGSYANGAFAFANTVNVYAYSAYAFANTRYSSSGGTVTGDVTITGSLTSNTDTVVRTTSTTTSSTSQITLDSFLTATYRSAKYLVQMTSGSSYHMLELSLIHDGTTVYLTQYGEVKTGSSLGTFDATISTGTLSVLFTPVNSVTTAKVLTTTIKV